MLNSDLDKTLESLVESFYDGVVFIENERVVRVNSSFSRITGLKGESLLGQKVDDLDAETHICLHTIQEITRLVQRLGKSVTSMGKLMLRLSLVTAGSYGAYALGANNVANVTAVFVGQEN